MEPNTSSSTSSSLDSSSLVVARHRIAPYVVTTPVVQNEPLCEELGATVYFKCENLQRTGAFKSRGACNAVLSLTQTQRQAGVVTHSSGNHAAALARIASLLGIPAHIVMPSNSRRSKINAVRRWGVEPIFCEPTVESRQRTAQSVQDRTGSVLVHPYDDRQVIAGQGTVALEFLDQVSELDTLVVPVGGGGLLAGTLLAVQHVSPSVQVVAAEPAWADDAFRSWKSGQLLPPNRYDSVADGLRTQLGELTFPMIHRWVDEILLVEEADIMPMARHLLETAHLLVEPSAAVAVAAIARHPSRFQGRRVGVILSGGNVDLSDLLL